jgi:AraC-like DNA-binding protein
MSRFRHGVEWLRAPQGVALVGRFTLTRHTRYSTHTHATHQVVWASTGVVTVGVGDTTWALPPSRAFFIPSGVPHTTAGASVADMSSVYLWPDQCPSLWHEPTVLAASPMFTALVGHLGTNLSDDARRRAEAVLFDVLAPAPDTSAELTWPRDDRARRVADALAADPADTRDAASWARSVGTSERTLSRLFVDETGVGFGRWRTRLRVRTALELLAARTPVAVAGRKVGYATASAFIAAFRREVGVTPSQCFRS